MSITYKQNLNYMDTTLKNFLFLNSTYFFVFFFTNSWINIGRFIFYKNFKKIWSLRKSCGDALFNELNFLFCNTIEYRIK
jgi:hypothetical protein